MVASQEQLDVSEGMANQDELNAPDTGHTRLIETKREAGGAAQLLKGSGFFGEAVGGFMDTVTGSVANIAEGAAQLNPLMPQTPQLEQDVERLRNHLSEANMLILRLQREVKMLEVQKMATESELKTCKLSRQAMSNQADSLREQNEALQEQLLRSQLDSQGLSNELERVKGQALSPSADGEANPSQNHDLMNKMKETQSEMEALKMECLRLKSHKTEAQALRTMIQSLQEDLQGQQRRVKQLEEELTNAHPATSFFQPLNLSFGST